METKILIGRDYLPEILKQVNAAKRTIYIIIFDWRIYFTTHVKTEVNLIAAVQAAKARGVDVKVIANNDYVVNELIKLQIKAKRAKFYKIVHAKMLLIDEKIAVIGSHNFTANSFERNLEISVMLTEPENSQTLTRYFNTLWN
jgi:phosphatidylserine/phosphatidylglycerophosphate/cardiolipin synthase-like enzyme